MTHPRPWKVQQLGRSCARVVDATGAKVCETGNTATGRETLARLVKVANMYPGVTETQLVDNAMRSIL